jgi:hypothetical protein
VSAPRGRLGAYAWWQLRDYMTGPGIGTLVIVSLVSVAPIFAMLQAMRGRAEGMPADELVGPLFLAFVQFIALVGPVVAVGGMVSSDRQPGLTRFLFAKPISVPLYYLQMWGLRGTGLLVITAALSLLVHRFAAPVAWWPAVLGVAITWVLLGGVGVLLSTLVPRDSIYLIGLYAVTTLLDQFSRIAPQWRWVEPVLSVLPPMHKLNGVRTALLGGSAPVAADLWHVLAWGLAALAAALLLMRRLPLVR